MAIGTGAALLGSAIIGGVGGAIQANQAKKAVERQQTVTDKQMEWGIGVVQQNTRSHVVPGLDKAGRLLKQGERGVMQGYAEAQASVAGVGQSARRRLLRRETQANNNADADLAARGLGSSTLMGQSRNANAEVTNEGLAQVDEQVAQMRSQLSVGRGHALAQSKANRAQFEVTRADTMTYMAEMMLNVGLSQSPSPEQVNNFLSQLDPSLGLAAAQTGPEGPGQYGTFNEWQLQNSASSVYQQQLRDAYGNHSLGETYNGYPQGIPQSHGQVGF